ncbi:unnamed protein product [Boreogadus saida]
MLLTDTGMVYGVSFADDQLDVNPSFRLCMQPNVIGDAQEPLITNQIYSSQNGALFLTGQYQSWPVRDRGHRRPSTLHSGGGVAEPDVWCGLHHTRLQLQDESGAKELHFCGCSTIGCLPGRPEGSHVFEKLNVQH